MATPINLRGDHITLGQALKVGGLAGTGGQAKLLVRDGRVRVNGEVETRPGRKLVAGDTIAADDTAEEWIVQA